MVPRPNEILTLILQLTERKLNTQPADLSDGVHLNVCAFVADGNTTLTCGEEFSRFEMIECITFHVISGSPVMTGSWEI